VTIGPSKTCANGEPLALRRERIDREESSFTFALDRKPDDSTIAITITP
jgi:hypothetical protein